MGVARLLDSAGPGLVADDLIGVVTVRDECAIVISETPGAAAALLDRAQRELSHRRIRCVRISAPPLGNLSLRGFMVQILGRPGYSALTDSDLETGFNALTEPGAGYDRVALLVDDAHNLQLPALRYIQLACQSSPKLRVVLAGRPALDSLLARNEFGPLHQQIRHRVELTGSPPSSLAMQPGSGRRKPSLPPRWLTSLNSGVGALASSVLIVSLAIWVLPTRSPPDAPAPLPPASTSNAGDQVASALETPAAPVATWTKRPADVSEPTEAPGTNATPLPEPSIPVSDAPPVPDEPPRLDPPSTGPVPEIRVADLEGDPAALRKLVPAAAVGHAPSLSPSGHPALQAPSEPVQHAAAALRRPVAPEESPRESPTESEEGRRCRDIVLNAQLGGTPSNADTLFLQNGCRIR